MNVKKEVNYLVDNCGTTDPTNLIKETGACIVDTIDLPDSTLGMTVSSYGQTTMLISPKLEYPKKILSWHMSLDILYSTRENLRRSSDDWNPVRRCLKLKLRLTSSHWLYC